MRILALGAFLLIARPSVGAQAAAPVDMNLDFTLHERQGGQSIVFRSNDGLTMLKVVNVLGATVEHLHTVARLTGELQAAGLPVNIFSVLPLVGGGHGLASPFVAGERLDDVIQRLTFRPKEFGGRLPDGRALLKRAAQVIEEIRVQTNGLEDVPTDLDRNSDYTQNFIHAPTPEDPHRIVNIDPIDIYRVVRRGQDARKPLF
jgi:hypothetical protein